METAIADQTPPRISLAGKLKKNLFNGPVDIVVTTACAALFFYLLYQVIDWAFLSSVWSADEEPVCRTTDGACWSVIDARHRIIFFGLFPYEEHWRSTLACFVMVATIVASCFSVVWSALRLSVLWLLGFGAFYILMHGGLFGLTVVTPERWGGLALTLFIFAAVSLLGMPLSVVLALGRRSKLPVVARMTGLFIDFFRSLPLLTILFTAAVITPFLLPGWLQTDKLYRVIIGFAIFFACYQAENIRAGLQAIPTGQDEAGLTLGLNYWQRVSRLQLPQAFRNSLPAIVNQFVITFKETSIVTIVGFFEILASGHAAYGTGQWTPHYVEVYVFIGLIYFVFVFSLSRYGAYLERTLRVGHG
ncbi:ABC transporter permease [Chromatiales bacterium (ex Bugula neritina AB1)]|nr:ABC transporter permease [Chromatiales bacterium (ex Bugula neritina AB1)]